MANSGPDLMMIDPVFCMESNDVSKMMHSGVFADMSEFIENDKDYNSKDYNQAVMNVGKVGDKQYIIPLFYYIPILLTTEKNLEETGFNISKCTDYWGFAGEVERYTQNIKPTSPIIFPEGSSAIQNFCNLAGIDILDYNKKSITVDTSEFKEAAGFYERLCGKVTMFNDNYSGQQFYFLNSGKSVFGFYSSDSFGDLLLSIQELYRKEKQPVMFPVRNKNGGVNALYNYGVGIRNNSANKQNAYNFAKLLLSEKYQANNSGSNTFGIPVLNSAIQSSYDDFYSKSLNTSTSTETYMSSPLPKKDFDQYMSFIKEITGATIVCGPDKKFRKIMRPFYKGEKSYEECIKTAKEQLEIYISE